MMTQYELIACIDKTHKLIEDLGYIDAEKIKFIQKLFNIAIGELLREEKQC